MGKKIFYVLILIFSLILIGCNTSLNIKNVDADCIEVKSISFSENEISFISSINDNKANEQYIYGLQISLLEDNTVINDKKIALINNNEYEIKININEFSTQYYGKKLQALPYIKQNDEIVYSNNKYEFNLIDEAKKAKVYNNDTQAVNTILDFANINYKKVYSDNNQIYIDNAVYEFDANKLGQEFLVDWNNLFKTTYNTFKDFASNNMGEYKNYYNTNDIANHNLYKFFNYNNQEYITKYEFMFDIITSLNICLITKAQINMLKNNNLSNQNEEINNYYGFYQLLSQIEALFTKTQIKNVEYSYITFDYASSNAYNLIQRYFENNEQKIYAIGNYDYYLIGDLYEINYTPYDVKGKEWVGYNYKNETYQINDLIEITENNMCLVSKYNLIPYSITFYDGDEQLQILNCLYNVESLDYVLPIKEKYGYNFIGWYTSKTFEENTKIDIIQSSSAINYTLYAKYEAKQYSQVNVIFDLQGGNFIGDEQINQTLQLPQKLPTPSRIGCSFVGWVCSLDNKVYTEYPGYFDFNKNIKYTAKWEAKDMTDAEKIEGTYQELVNEFNKIEIITSNLEFIYENSFYKTTIEYKSSDESILTNTGILSRPYEEDKLTMLITITSNNDSKQYSYEFKVAGYKKLDNIASTYVYGGYNKLTDEFFETMDIIFCAFVLIDVDGGFTGLDGAGKSIKKTNDTYLNYMKTYVLPRAKEKGIRVVASIGGGGNSVDLAYEEIVKSDAKMTTLANNIVKLINEYGFDGADIDWEIPNEATSFSKLSKKVYEAVKANNSNHIVTAAIGGGKWQPPKYDLTVSKNYLDYVNLMTYNMVGNGGYHHTALYKSTKLFDSVNKVGHTLQTCSIEESMDIYKNNYGVEASQIIIGAAFYGMKQKRTLSNGVYSSWSSNGTISYTSIKNEYLNNSNYEYYYDTNCEAPYILSKDKTLFISYDDPRSIKAKCEYIKEIGAAGIMYWQNGQDTTGDLVKAIKEGLNK